jgi:L-asparaginase
LPSGIVLRNNEVNDDEKGFVASGELNPAKSRVLLQLALTEDLGSRADPEDVL